MVKVTYALMLALGCIWNDVPTQAAPAPAPAPVPVTDAEAILRRGGSYLGTPERFNRMHTEPQWQPRRTLYVSARGSDSIAPASSTRDAPTSPSRALQVARAGDEVRFLHTGGRYAGCYELEEENSGTYDAPVVLRAEEGVQMNCCDSGRAACFNIEGADHVAVIGFELIGGSYGVRAVGLGTRQDEHQRGLAILHNVAHDQWKDPFFTAHSDWAAIVGNTGYGAGEGDGHGIYVSNGSDRVIIKDNELHSNAGSDLQVNADPDYSCLSFGIALEDEACWGSVEDNLGAGVSEFFLIEGNFLHDGHAQGPNFTSMRRSVVRNNIFGPYARHGVSFWQETDLPSLGSSSNLVEGNLIIGSKPWSHAIQFIRHANNNRVTGNILLGLDWGAARTDPEIPLVELDEDSTGNHFTENIYVGGHAEHPPEDFAAQRIGSFSPTWFARFPDTGPATPGDWTPSEEAPFNRLGGWTPLNR